MAARSRRRDSSGHLDPHLQRRRRYEAALGPLGLWESFARMPRRAQDLFAQHKFPDPVLEFDASFPADPAHLALRKSLESAFRDAVMEVDGVDVTVRDFFSVIAGLHFTIRDTRDQPGFPEECVRFMRDAGPLLDRWYEESLPSAWPSLHQAVLVPLVAHSRLDARLLSATPRCDQTAHGKYRIRVVIGATEPQVRRATLDGAPRPLYRVGTSNEWDHVRWLSWDAATALGPTGARPQALAEYPVYVQSHALRQLHRRVNLPTMAPYLECWLHISLREPRVVERQGADLLVEYRIHQHRLGYLVVTPLPDLVVVRTFLFLTMEHTPEARMLNRHLRLTRRDVDWLGLHELAAFTQTDMSRDPVLRPLMDACGCGHLFELRNYAGAAACAPEPKSFATEVRRYLRMAA